jgi:hypothetical protein
MSSLRTVHEAMSRYCRRATRLAVWKRGADDGQITSTFDDNPQLPFSRLQRIFKTPRNLNAVVNGLACLTGPYKERHSGSRASRRPWPVRSTSAGSSFVRRCSSTARRRSGGSSAIRSRRSSRAFRSTGAKLDKLHHLRFVRVTLPKTIQRTAGGGLFAALRGQVDFDLIGRITIPGGKGALSSTASARTTRIRTLHCAAVSSSSDTPGVRCPASYAAVATTAGGLAAACAPPLPSARYGPGFGRGFPPGNASRRIVRCTVPSCLPKRPELYGRP